MNGSTLVPVFVSGLVGSLHCAAMCGGLVANYASAAAKQRALAHAAYNGARLCAYVLLGAIAGSVGHALDFAGAEAGIGRVAAFVAGSLMVVWGLAALAELSGFRAPRLRMPRPIADLNARLVFHALQGSPLARAAGLGAASALLPCGWLYVFVTNAAGTADPWRGAAVMAAFGLGTVPLLLGLGTLLQRATQGLRQRIPYISAALVLALGVYTLALRMDLPAFAAPLLGARGSHSTSQLPCHTHREH